MALFRIDEDKKTIAYEKTMADKPDYFKIEVTEREKTIHGLINEDEAEILVVALNQFISRKRKTR